jgi:hypothetical protein
MRVFRVVMAVGLLMIPVTHAVFAQNMTPGFRLNEGKEYTDEEIARNKKNEDDAKAARAKIPDGKVSSDPWATVRSEPAAKAPKAHAK